MQRQLMDELIAWKSRANRKPLLLKGARQTGKTWLLNEFAGQQYQNVIRFDFMLEPGARSLFDGSLDPKRIISQIELLRGQTITPTDTLIIFDEIQEAPRGITSLKYFNELAPEYHIVAAGSYMGLALRRENESFPVGKIDQLTMRPMGFVEFVRAVDGDPLADAILAADMDLLANVSEKLERLLKEYLVVGGMPEVVSAFAASHDFIEARRLQQQLPEEDDQYAGVLPWSKSSCATYCSVSEPLNSVKTAGPFRTMAGERPESAPRMPVSMQNSLKPERSS